MAIIGKFAFQNNIFTGKIQTLTVNTPVTFVPNTRRTSDKGPDFLLMAGDSELGAAWKKLSEKQTPYLFVTVDDPSFPADFMANMYETDDGSWHLIWKRDRRN
jgi:uncharacterized protein (DUF736 family)